MELLQRGVYPTMITPYTKTGEIDYDMAAALVDWYARKGCRGVFAVCQSSEVAYLSLHERVRLARTVVEAAAGRLDVVASGHISESPQAQAEVITAVAETGVRAVVLVSNRLDHRQDGDAVWLQRAETLLSRLPQELMLGIYECPQPYKRLLTPVILDWCVGTGRFAFIKDTCCDPAELTARLQRLRGTGVGCSTPTSRLCFILCSKGRGDIPGSWRISIRSCWCGCAISGSGSRRRRSGCKTI